MTIGGTGEPAPVAHAFAVMLADFDQMVKLLADGGMEDFDDRGSVGFMQDSNGSGTSCHWLTTS